MQHLKQRSSKYLKIARHQNLGGGNSNIFNFHPYLGKWSNLTNIFQRGWNHQLEMHEQVFSTPLAHHFPVFRGWTARFFRWFQTQNLGKTQFGSTATDGVSTVTITIQYRLPQKRQNQKSESLSFSQFFPDIQKMDSLPKLPVFDFGEQKDKKKPTP